MKTILSTLFLILSLSIFAQTQETKIKDEESDEIIEFVNGIRSIEHFFDCQDWCIDITLIECANSIERSSVKGWEEAALFNLYFRIILLDEESIKPSIRNFWVEGGYLNPRNYKFEAKTRKVTFIHGAENEPISISISILKTSVLIE